jgi:indole-3-glycerol phosphate synthase
MASILDQIFAAKRTEVEAARQKISLDAIMVAAKQASAPRSFIGALRAKRPAIIAEVKRASPSKGDILPGLNPPAVALDYASAGAAAISVLTDRHFKGSLEDLRAVRDAVELPLLRKDFMFDEYQVYEARAAGADAILLIAAMLEKEQMHSLATLADELGMAALVEVHNKEELVIAESIAAKLIGINNRDLHTFKTDIATTEELLRGYHGPALVVSESGIDKPEDIRRLDAAGAGAFLIGESLLREGRPREALGLLTRALDDRAVRTGK